MLSGESAIGRHPLKAVDAMDRILRETERFIARFAQEPHIAVHNDHEAQAESAVSLAYSSNADAVLVFTRSGRTAASVSKFRPRVPVFAFTPDETTRTQLALHYGVSPFFLEFVDPEETIRLALEAFKATDLVPHAKSVVLISDTQTANAPVSTLQIRELTA